jgi:ferredoxin-NADP reductase
MLIGLADAAVAGLWSLSASVRHPPEPVACDPTIELAVARRALVAHDADVVALTLCAPRGGVLPPWRPGAHIDIQLPSGRVRQYSLTGSPDARGSYRIAVRRILGGGGGSIEVHQALQVGARVRTNGPRNAFPLTLPGYGSPMRRLRFVAGVIGITPILPMVKLADRLGVDWSLVYAGRSADSMPFLDELARFSDRVEVRTDDRCGVPSADALLGDCPDGTAVYACGPAPMLTALRSRLAGRDRVELHFERFAAAPVIDGEEFTVTIASSGATVPVGAAETLLSALRRDGVDPPYSCQQGFCGTCRTKVLAGTAQHRDTLLTGPERDDGVMLVCVSRARGGDRLTLDL